MTSPIIVNPLSNTAFLNSIFNAAGESNGYDKFKSNPKQSTKDIMNLLRHQNHTNQLIASWSAKWLVDHYYLQHNETKGNFILYGLEIPLSKISGRIRPEHESKKKYYSKMT